MDEGEIRVESSNIATVRYIDGECVLQVRFRNGRVYRYHKVPRESYEGLMRSDSHGKYLHAHIIPRFEATEVGT
ncbi:MAG: KTSC domain-containing protein [Thaumarchaeota archaeon]|nr:KTSC domain-containing protein [Nitrososphaerota archaeon]